MVLDHLLHPVLQNTSMIIRDGLSLDQGFVSALHDLRVVVVVGFEDKVEGVAGGLVVEMVDLSPARG